MPVVRGGSQTQELGEMCQTLKALAMELGICVVLLAQLARDKENPYPTLARLKGSGDIENNADNVYFVFRPEYYRQENRNESYGGQFKNVSVSGTAEIIQAKGRNTGIGSFIAGYRQEYTEFYDLPQSCLPCKSAYPAGDGDDDPPF